MSIKAYGQSSWRGRTVTVVRVYPRNKSLFFYVIFFVGINDAEIVPLTNFWRRTAMSVISARQGPTTRSISPTHGRWHRKSENRYAAPY